MEDESSLLTEKTGKAQEVKCAGKETNHEQGNSECDAQEEVKDGFTCYNQQPEILEEANKGSRDEDMMEERMDTVYLHSELSDNIPPMDDQSMGYLMDSDIGRLVDENMQEYCLA